MANDLNWVENFSNIKSHKAFVQAKAAFEAECREKLGAKAFSYRQGKISAGCETKPNGKAALPKLDPSQVAMLKALLAAQ